MMEASKTSNQVEDAELIRKALEGDQRAYSALYERYSSRLYSYCRRLLDDHVQAEEGVQQTFIKAFRSLESLDDPKAFYYWLFTIARNEVYSSIRKQKRNGRPESISDESVWLEDPSHESVVASELHELVNDALRKLKHEYQEVLVLRHDEGLSYAEISAITGDTVSSIESRLTRARHAMKNYLKPFVEEWRRS